MIEINNLTKVFKKVTALDNLSLEVKQGEIFGFLGPNGAGKTTLIKILCGLLKPTGGEVSIGGYKLGKDDAKIKQIIGLISDNPFVYPKLTGREFLEFVGNLYFIPKSEQEKKIPDYLEMFELAAGADDLTETYSRGMQQKLVFASVLLHNPKVIFLDEPMVGLDPKSTRLVKEKLLHLAKDGITIFMSTHTLEIAEKICSRIGIIQRGKLLALGTKEELRANARLLDNQNLEEIFLHLTSGVEEKEVIEHL